MTRKKFLITMVSLMFLLGIIGAMIPFVASLKPNARSDSSLTRIDISNINRGQFMLVNLHEQFSRYGNNYNGSILIYLNKSGHLKSWFLPSSNGKIAMPDLHWWRPIYLCERFGPHTIDGIVDESKPIECHDQKPGYEWWQTEWRWDLNGKNLGKMVDDLEASRGVQEGKYLVIGKRS